MDDSSSSSSSRGAINGKRPIRYMVILFMEWEGKARDDGKGEGREGRDEALQIRYDLMTITIQARLRRSLVLLLPARPRNVIPVAFPRSTRPTPPLGHRAPPCVPPEANASVTIELTCGHTGLGAQCTMQRPPA